MERPQTSRQRLDRVGITTVSSGLPFDIFTPVDTEHTGLASRPDLNNGVRVRRAATRARKQELAAVAGISQSVWLCHGIRRGDSSNQPSAAAEGEILESPLNKNQNTALKFHNVHQVYKKPDEPRRPSGNVHTKNVRDRRSSANDRHVALIEIMKRTN